LFHEFTPSWLFVIMRHAFLARPEDIKIYHTYTVL